MRGADFLAIGAGVFKKEKRQLYESNFSKKEDGRLAIEAGVCKKEKRRLYESSFSKKEDGA